MKVTSKYSSIEIIKKEELKEFNQINVIQVEITDDYFIVEYVPRVYEENYRNEQPKQQLSLAEQNKREQLENEYNDALEIVLNNDPQGKWSGCTLAEILAKDIEWFKWAKSDMRNPYIKKFVCVICEHDNIK
jgi:hypothetical protein